MPEFQQKYGMQSNTPAGIAIVPVSLAASFIASFVSNTYKKCNWITHKVIRSRDLLLMHWVEKDSFTLLQLFMSRVVL
jgi:hypothetical protein